LTYSNIGKTHGKPKIVPTSHKFTKLTLIAFIMQIALLAIKVFYFFPVPFSKVKLAFWGVKNTHKMIEGNPFIWIPLTWNINLALQGLFDVPYNEFQ
jgi:hypothetical protein